MILLHSHEPSAAVNKFLTAVQKALAAFIKEVKMTHRKILEISFFHSIHDRIIHVHCILQNNPTSYLDS